MDVRLWRNALLVSLIISCSSVQALPISQWLTALFGTSSVVTTLPCHQEVASGSLCAAVECLDRERALTSIERENLIQIACAHGAGETALFLRVTDDRQAFIDGFKQGLRDIQKVCVGTLATLVVVYGSIKAYALCAGGCRRGPRFRRRLN